MKRYSIIGTRLDGRWDSRGWTELNVVAYPVDDGWNAQRVLDDFAKSQSDIGDKIPTSVNGVPALYKTYAAYDTDDGPWAIAIAEIV